MRIVIGTIGEKGAGKETFYKLLMEVVRDNKILSSLEQFRFSDPLRKTLDDYDIDVTRPNLQDLASLLERFRRGAVTNGLKKLLELKRAKINVLDGVRWPSDEKFIRSESFNIMVYVTANADIRFERLRNRGEKAKEKGMTRKQFNKEEKAATEIYIPKIGKRADFKIINEGTLEEYKKQVQKFFDKLLKPMLKKKD